MNETSQMNARTPLQIAGQGDAAAPPFNNGLRGNRPTK
jgi:hypothetical protein